MGISTSLLRPQELVTFKKLPPNIPLGNIEVPERADNRRPTNVKWLVILGIAILILLPFLIYTLYYSDINRAFGYDKCGNICGRKNYKWNDIHCSGQDLTSSPFLQYEGRSEYRGGDNYAPLDDLKERSCVSSCRQGHKIVLGVCIEERYPFEEYPISANNRHYYLEESHTTVLLSNIKWQIVISCLMSILVAMGMMFLFRYAVTFVVWGILLGCFVGLLLLTGTLWHFYNDVPTGRNIAEDSAQMMFCFAIVATILSVILGIVLIWFRKKVNLVILLLKETTKAVFDMPGLIVVPVMCVIATLILTALFVITTVFMYTAGRLQLVSNGFHTYGRDPAMIFTMVFNFIVYVWLSNIFIGIQYMIIAGAVAKWYFSQDKSLIRTPISSSVVIAFKYHLGTVAFGALIISAIGLIKIIILSLTKRFSFPRCFVDSIETFLRYLSKNAYIVTAIHGQSFLRSGKRATKLIVQNASDIIAVNYISDFVLIMARILIVAITILIATGIFAIAPAPDHHTNVIAYLIVAAVSLLVALISFGIFETSIDTIFICYCEDMLLNNGMSKPYLMSRNLQEFVQESKRVYRKK